jgi:hypothetical protein
MEALALVIGSLALAAGTGLVIVALLHLESSEREGYVSEGWRYDHQSRFQKPDVFKEP